MTSIFFSSYLTFDFKANRRTTKPIQPGAQPGFF